MPGVRVLQRNWRSDLSKLLLEAEAEVFISSPFITSYGVNFVKENIAPSLFHHGRFTILTDLSPGSVSQGSIDPGAILSLAKEVHHFKLFHLPRLHAKVYVCDARSAIITSGNLTSGGLVSNLEYGVCLTNASTVEAIKLDFTAYANLGAEISRERLSNYCSMAEGLRAAFRDMQGAVPKADNQYFRKKIQQAEDELIRSRLAPGAPHSVYARTILYLLTKYGPLTTSQIHTLVEEIHPDLCDNSVDRVIDGKRFGKKWKHAVRTAQQHLKRKKLIKLVTNHWMLKNAEPPRHEHGKPP